MELNEFEYWTYHLKKDQCMTHAYRSVEYTIGNEKPLKLLLLITLNNYFLFNHIFF